MDTTNHCPNCEALAKEIEALRKAVAVKDAALRVALGNWNRAECNGEDEETERAMHISLFERALSSTPSGMVDSRDKVVKALLEGLTTDGAHHKQWALEKAFRALCQDDYVDEARAEFCWDEGIAP